MIRTPASNRKMTRITSRKESIIRTITLGKPNVLEKSYLPDSKIFDLTKFSSNVFSRDRTLVLTESSVKTKKGESKRESFLGALFFTSANKLFTISSKRDLNLKDLELLPENSAGSNALKDFRNHFINAKVPSGHNLLWKSLIKYQRSALFNSVACRLVSDLIMVTMPLIIREYTNSIKSNETNNNQSLVMFFTIPSLLLIQDLFRQHSERYISIAKTNIGQALRCHLYEKLLTADYYFLANADHNILTRLIFFEIDHLLEGAEIVSALISGPVAVIFSGFLVVYYLISTINIWLIIILTITEIFTFIFLLNYFNRISTRARDKYSMVQSHQAAKIQELIENIDLVKINKFSNYFENGLKNLRVKADRYLRITHRMQGLIESILVVAPFLFSLCLVNSNDKLTDTQMETPQVFTIIAMTIAVTVPLRSFSDSLRKMRIFHIAYTCLDGFFENLKEYSPDHCDWFDITMQKGEIIIDGCTFTADKGYSIKNISDIFQNTLAKSNKNRNDKIFTIIRSRFSSKSTVVPSSSNNLDILNRPYNRTAVLKKISIRIRSGQKVCLLSKDEVGRMQFILALLGELELKFGVYKRNGKIGYLDIENQKFLKSTIRDNIILGEMYSSEKLKLVCKQVRLNLNKYPGRDLTEIVEGERNIFAADRKKILLARLLYMEPHIVIINKYFDRESKEVQLSLFNDIVNGYFADKTVIYTTNVNLLMKHSTQILVINNGEIAERGKYHSLLKQKKSLMYSIVMSDTSGSTNFFGKILEGRRIVAKEAKNEMERSLIISQERVKEVMENNSEDIVDQLHQDANSELNHWIVKSIDLSRGKNLREEEDFVLKNRLSSAKGLLLEGGGFRSIMTLALFIITDLLLVLVQLYMAMWATKSLEFTFQGYLNIYTVLVVIIATFVLGREVMFQQIFLGNLTQLYNKTVESILNAKKDWYFQNPASRIVYLMTKDQTVIDHDLPRTLFTTIDTMIVTLAILGILNYCFIGILLVLTIVICYLAYLINIKFDRVSQKLLAITTKSRAELMGVYLDTFDNMIMLRVKGKKNYFVQEFYEKTNQFQMASTNLYNHSMRWLNLRVTFLAVFFIMSITGIPLAYKYYYGSDVFKNSWQLSFALGTSSFLLASLVNFSKSYPLTMLNLLSAQRIYRYIFDQTKDPSKNSLNIEVPKNHDLKLNQILINLSKRIQLFQNVCIEI